MKCKNCNEKDAVKYSKYSSGEFCSKECAMAYTSKFRTKESYKKVSDKLKGRKISKEIVKKISGENNGRYKNGDYVISDLIEREIFCLICNKPLTKRSKNHKFCSIECRNKSNEYKEKLSIKSIKKCENIEERIRLREIGRKGGFGKKGITDKGTKYQSILEKKCFEFLEENKINFIPHKYIPNSSKISDIYFPEKDLWVELDGIDREKKKKWLGKDYQYWLEKIQIYKDNNLKLKIFKNFDDFKNFWECSSVG